jgi:hypothetical protein
VIKRISILLAVSIAAFGIVQVGSAADPPFPATKVGDLFLSVQTVNNTGAIVTQVKPGDTVIFRAYSLDPKSKKFMTAPEKRYFYLELPGWAFGLAAAAAAATALAGAVGYLRRRPAAKRLVWPPIHAVAAAIAKSA